MKPLISIVTVNYNGEKELPKLLSSVAALLARFDTIEHVIIDGGSRDGSHALLSAHQQAHAAVTYLSEPDRGIYDAMNKGVRLSRGGHFLHLNSDDYAINHDYWEEALRVLREDQPAILTADVPLVLGRDVMRYLPGRPLSRMHRLNGYHFPHQGTFFSRALFDAYGPYLLNAGYVADKLYAYRLIDSIDFSTVRVLDQPISVQQIGGVSSFSVYTPLRTFMLTAKNKTAKTCRRPQIRALFNLFYKVKLGLTGRLKIATLSRFVHAHLDRGQGKPRPL